MTVRLATRPASSVSATSLKPPSMSKAAASARAVHPEDAEAAVVGHELARADRVDVLGRERDADDAQRAAGGR